MFSALRKTWPNITLYQEHIPQGFKTPCFFIAPLSPTHVGRLGGYRTSRDYPFIVHYFAGKWSDKHEECSHVGDRLIDVLEYIPGDITPLRRGFDISYEISDEDVCLFKITYRVEIERKHPEVKMQEISHHEVIIDGKGNESEFDPDGANSCDECGEAFCERVGEIAKIRSGGVSSGGS